MKQKRGFDRGLGMIYLFFLVYFFYNGFMSFMPKYYGEIGITDSQIGLINAASALASTCAQPIIGSLTDRAKYKKTVIAVSAIISGVLYFLTGLTVKFVPVLIGMACISMVNLSIMPGVNTIALEYTTKNKLGKLGNYGPIRMVGTMGYQIGALGIGIILSGNLRNLLYVMAAILIISAFIVFALPNVEGHQHEGRKVSYFSLFKNKKVVMMMGMIFLAEITQQFNQNFLTKMQGDMGMSNASTGLITFLSVVLELPICFFGFKLYKKLPIWWWLIVAYVVNALRWFAYSFAKTPTEFILIGLPGVTIMACFELFPAFYLNEIIEDELKASAQGLLSIFTFGIPRIIGCLVGGFIAESIGLPSVYRMNGIILIVLTVVFIVPCMKMSKADKKA
ncbi:MAG: MFS transporter [Clostridia bacterium]|nr:MFS transporter [Clostridia bacterium]